MYEDVLTALADAHVRFVVTGGVAVVLHGCPRSVPDLDVVVDPAPANLDATTASLARLGFWPTIPLPLAAVVVLRTMDAHGREVDVNRVYTIPFQALSGQAAVVTIEGRAISVISKDDLIAVKLQRGRGYDLEDVALLRSA